MSRCISPRIPLMTTHSVVYETCSTISVMLAERTPREADLTILVCIEGRDDR